MLSGSSEARGQPHDLARRIDCGFLAELVMEHRLEDWEAAELAQDLAYGLAKRAYRL